MNISTIDFKLLVVFDALYEHGQVTRAAQNVGLTQPAVSNALSRLRSLFGDRLFVRVGNAMEPTPRARELKGHITALLTHVSQIVGPSVFVPADSALTFRIATTDHIEITLLPALLRRLRAEAPALKLVSRRLGGIFDIPREELESGSVDLAIGPFPQPHPPNSNISGRRLYAERLVCITRAIHPMARRKLSLAAFAKMEHVAVCYPTQGTGLVDRLLQEHEMKRNAPLVVPHLFSAAAAVAQSDYIATVPFTLARHLAKSLRLAIMNLPLAAPALSIGVFWHRRNTDNRASLWVRETISKAVRDMGLDTSTTRPRVRRRR